MASSLGVLVTASKNASGHSIDDPSTNYLRSCAKLMVANVSTLLQTFKTVGENGNAAIGAQTVEDTIAVIDKQLIVRS